MGCDIHLYKEKHVDGKWVAADKWEAYDYGDDDKGQEVPWRQRFTERNYELFGLLAKGVRANHDFSFQPRGIPFNVCQEVAADFDSWGSDGHNHSYLYLHELREMVAYLEVATIRVSGMKDAEELAALKSTIDAGAPNWNLLFPYCGWTNSIGAVEFELDVPASFYMGAGLKRIIDGFDGIDGDNHRIVFCFDN